MQSLMVLEWKITCTCYQAKLEKCCQTPPVAPIAPNISTGEFVNTLNPDLQSDLISDHSRNTRKTHTKQHTKGWSHVCDYSCTTIFIICGCSCKMI